MHVFCEHPLQMSSVLSCNMALQEAPKEVQEHVLTLLLQDCLLAILTIVKGLGSARDRAHAMKALKASTLGLPSFRGQACLGYAVLSRQACAGGCSACASFVSSHSP